MSKRTLAVSFLTAGMTAGLVAGVVGPAAAQGNPVGGSGNVYYLGGAGSTGGAAQMVMPFGNPDDEVYFGDWDNDGVDTPMVNRNGEFHVSDKAGKTVDVFGYGNPGDRVVIGDWDNKNGDSMAVVRTEQGSNKFYVKNDVKTTGKADDEFFYGDAGDNLLVGDWDGENGDTLMVTRPDGSFHVKNDTETGVADYSFFYGNPGDSVLVGDWADPAKFKDGDGADQIAVRRGNHYFLSNELEEGKPITALRDLHYGEASDTVFVAALESKIGEPGNKLAPADIPAIHAKGDPVLVGSSTGSTITQPTNSYGTPETYAGGEAKVRLQGAPKVYLGTEPETTADGKPVKYVAFGTTNLRDGEKDIPNSDGTAPRFVSGQYVLNSDGDFVYGKNPSAPYPWERVTWSGTTTWNTRALPTGDANKMKVAVGDVALQNRGEVQVHVTGEPAVYEVGGEFAANVTVDLVTGSDFALDDNNDPILDTTTAALDDYRMATLVQKAGGFAPGAPVLHRKGEQMKGYQYTPAADVRNVTTGTIAVTLGVANSFKATVDAANGAFTPADTGRRVTVAGTGAVVLPTGARITEVLSSTKVVVTGTADGTPGDAPTSLTLLADTEGWGAVEDITNDEAANMYVTKPALGGAPTAANKKVSDLDADTKQEPGVYLGTEQRKFTAIGLPGLVVSPYAGGEAIIAQKKGEVMLDKDGNPIKVTLEDVTITGDGLGVRR